MHIETEWQPAFRISPNEDTIKALIKVAQRHYDFACRSMADGALAQWLQRVESGWADCVYASFRDLDTTLKLCEMRAVVCDPYELTLLDSYVRDVGKALRDANARYRELNPQENGGG